MATENVNIDDVKIIFCVQGYSLNYDFILREIGFWTHGYSGSIPFNCRINLNQLDVQSLKIINVLEDQIHGIKVKNHVDCGLALSESRAVVRSLYHMNSWKCESKRIGICRDPNISGLLHKAGLGKFVIDLDELAMFKNTTDKVPSNKDLQEFMRKYPQKYTICSLHDKLKSGEVPLCAKVKAEFIADYCLNYQTNLNETIKSIIDLENIESL